MAIEVNNILKKNTALNNFINHNNHNQNFV